MSKLTATLMSSAAHLSEPKRSHSAQNPGKTSAEARMADAEAASIIESSSAANQGSQRAATMARTESDEVVPEPIVFERTKPVAAGSDSEEDEPDELVPDPIVCREFNISAMTLWRWDHDPELAALGLPPPVIIRKRKFRVRRQLESFKQHMLRRAIEQRTEAAIAREMGAKT